MKRKATPVQKFMIACIGVIFVALVIFAVPEIIGIFSPATEDTFSEWVFDKPRWFVYSFGSLSFIVGGIIGWSGLHYIEGSHRRHPPRAKESRNAGNQADPSERP